MNNEQVFKKITDFLAEIGIYYRLTSIEEETFLPGLKVDRGTLLIDKPKCLYYGDMLHEAGHIALLKPDERNAKAGDFGDDGKEIGVQLWSYAAAVHIGLAPEVVFHEHGYKGDANWLIEQYTSQQYVGLPLLQWMELTYDEENAKLHNEKPFPHMLKWLVD